MAIEFDPAKNALNIANHGVSLASVEEFDMRSALIRQDTRFEYGEDRFVALGALGGELFVLVFTMRGDAVRAISLRPANKKERALWPTP